MRNLPVFFSITASLLGGCGAATTPIPDLPHPVPVRPGPAPDLVFADGDGLPPIPFVDGPLALRVVYPPEGSTVGNVDSSFIFGSTGTGRARLTINGLPVDVHPNGSWLAWVGFPRDTVMRFALRAVRGDAVVEVVHQVRRVPAFVAPEGVWVDTTSFAPRGMVWWPTAEPLPLSVRAVEGAQVRLVLENGRIIPFQAVPETSGVLEGQRAFGRDVTELTTRVHRYVGAMVGESIGPPLPSPVSASADVPANPRRRGSAWLEVLLGEDTLRVVWPVSVSLLLGLPPVITLDDDHEGTGTTDGLSVGRTVPGGTYHWFFPEGTRTTVTGRVNEDLRVGLSKAVEAWVPVSDAVALLDGVVLEPAIVGFPAASPEEDRVTVRFPLSYRTPYQVIEEEQAIRLLFYHAVGDPNWIRYGPTHGPLHLITWQQESSDEVEFRLALDRPLWGYRLRWEGSDLMVEMRGPPPIDPAAPLSGRRIAVDAGHPPGGATGPGGLTEAVANLAIALRLAVLLREAGAEVVLTRPDTMGVDLWPRVAAAEAVDADLLVSIHNNALPDGVNPFRNHGTSVYYFHPRSATLARAVQRELVARLGLPDLGVGRGDLALVRGTWMPSILTEGLFLMMPVEEAALGSATGQALYAQGVFRGILGYLSGIATP